MKFKRLKEYDTIWHEDSTLVFKSATEKLVVGRYVDGKMIKLDSKALEICKEWKFKYDETIPIDDDDEDEGEEEVEGEGEEEVEGEGEEEVEGEEEEEGEDEEEGESEVVVEDVKLDEITENSANEEVIIEKEKENTDVPNKDDFSVKFVFLNKCLNELSSSVDSHKKNSEKEISELKDEISKGNKKYDILKNNYDSLEDQYLKLKAKFEGIKNFFS